MMHGFTSTCSREFYGFGNDFNYLIAIYFGIYGEIMKFFIPKNKTIKDAAWYAPCIGIAKCKKRWCCHRIYLLDGDLPN
jgi:hypothetical protein